MKKIKIWLSFCLLLGLIPTLSVHATEETSPLSPKILEEIVSTSLKEREAKIEKKDKSVGEHDEALSLITLMEGYGGKLENYDYEFTLKSIEENENGDYVVSGYLIQTFYWVGDSTESAMGDDISFIINKSRKIENINYPQSIVSSSDIVKKSNEIRKIYKKNETVLTSKKSEVTTLAASSWTPYTYNGTAAATYAQTYALSPNTSKYYVFSNDCTNFASQALYAGGIPMRKDSAPHENRPNWWIQFYDAGQFLYAVPWVNANEFFLTIRGTDTIDGFEASTPEALYLGDIISYDKGNDLTMNHTAIVTSFVNTPNYHTPRVSYHTTNRKDVPWDYYILNTSGTVTAEFTRIS